MLFKNAIRIFAAAGILLTGCTSAPKVDVRAEADAIRNLEDQWAVAIRSKDVDKIVSYYAPDAVSMPADKPILSGTQAIRKSQEAEFADTTSDYKTYSSKVDAVEVSASGDLAVARGSDRISQKTAAGPVEEAGKWMDVWKKLDGTWKVIASTWNNNQPQPKQ
ncbi:MAG: nuclear transport factor 2 family protein [Bacteroidia bacterium]|nr:nuclear transport factor 2 family protein [Bacteroidia bacterium]